MHDITCTCCTLTHIHTHMQTKMYKYRKVLKCIYEEIYQFISEQSRPTHLHVTFTHCSLTYIRKEYSATDIVMYLMHSLLKKAGLASHHWIPHFALHRQTYTVHLRLQKVYKIAFLVSVDPCHKPWNENSNEMAVASVFHTRLQICSSCFQTSHGHVISNSGKLSFDWTMVVSISIFKEAIGLVSY